MKKMTEAECRALIDKKIDEYMKKYPDCTKKQLHDFARKLGQKLKGKWE